MSSHVLKQLNDLKAQLQKNLSDKTKAGVESSAFDEHILDVLKALENVKMTADLIKSSGLGSTVSKVREGYTAESPIYSKALQLLSNWKAIMTNAKQLGTTENIEKDPSRKLQQQAAIVQFVPVTSVDTSVGASPMDSSQSTLDAQNIKRKKALKMERLTIFNALRDIFKLSSASAKAESVALNIEEALHTHFTDSKTYNTKAKFIAFNLKKNKVNLVTSLTKRFSWTVINQCHLFNRV